MIKQPQLVRRGPRFYDNTRDAHYDTTLCETRRTEGSSSQEIQENRHWRVRKLFKRLNAKLRGYYSYYGVIGNIQSLRDFVRQARKILYKWLNRRSQKRSVVYKGFDQVCEYYRIEKPRITEKRDYQFQLNLS